MAICHTLTAVPSIPVPHGIAGIRQCLAGVLVGSGLASALAAAPPQFIPDIQPILEAHCIKCHGPEKQRSGYRLDVKSIALTGGEGSAPNIVPRQGAASPLLKYIKGEVEDMRMPPEGDALSAADVAKIQAWIDAGAPWLQPR